MYVNGIDRLTRAAPGRHGYFARYIDRFSGL
jgi:hypothetical protein